MLFGSLVSGLLVLGVGVKATMVVKVVEKGIERRVWEEDDNAIASLEEVEEEEEEEEGHVNIDVVDVVVVVMIVGQSHGSCIMTEISKVSARGDWRTIWVRGSGDQKLILHIKGYSD